MLVGWLCSAAAGSVDTKLESLEKLATEWVKTRAETVRIETEWETERGLLASTVAGLKERATQLEDRRDHLRAKTADERAELETLAQKKATGAAELAAIEERLTGLSGQLLALRGKLPPRLASALEYSFASLESDELSPGERMQLTISVLNRCAQFNASVTCGEEVLAFSDAAAPKAVDSIYWGLSHGYALDRSSGMAWYGAPGADGWAWTQMPEAVEPVNRLIAIYNDQRDPELVAVPARLASAGPR